MIKMATIVVVAIILQSILAIAASKDNSANFSSDEDFDKGKLINVNHEITHNQLQLNNEPAPFNFIWVAASDRGTIIKIDTNTGKVLGEYWSSPEGKGRDPSRTTVDNNGNVWAGNRAEKELVDGVPKGSVVQIGLLENGQCIDRNGNGKIDTSNGLEDIKPWKNSGKTDDKGGVSTAEDECIIKYLRTSATGVRTLAVDFNNNIWIGGRGNYVHELYDGNTGEAIPNSRFQDKCGGYGGLLDNNGVLWSSGEKSNCFLRYDTIAKSSTDITHDYPYGLARDSKGNIWNSQWSQFDAKSYKISKFSPEGALLGTYPSLGNFSRGVAITPDDNVWIANSGSNTVTRLDSNGSKKALIYVGVTPTGVAVDPAGKVWATNKLSNNTVRIDPSTNMVDLVVDLGPGAGPYDYSDMTGKNLVSAPNTGTWSIVHDSSTIDNTWKNISWHADIPADAVLLVKAASSKDGVNFGALTNATNGDKLEVPAGRYLKLAVTFKRASAIKGPFRTEIGKSPILYDLTLADK